MAAHALAGDSLQDWSGPNAWREGVAYFLGMSDAGLGDRDGALKAIASLDSLHLSVPEARRSSSLQAAIYAALGEKEQALVLLDEAWAKGDPDLRVHWHRMPELEPVRNLPAFRRMVGEVR
jgi:hypothetical protein